jgi:hypothetical protein
MLKFSETCGAQVSEHMLRRLDLLGLDVFRGTCTHQNQIRKFIEYLKDGLLTRYFLGLFIYSRQPSCCSRQ